MDELWNEIVRAYGTRCEPFKEEIKRRLDALIACTLYKSYPEKNPLYSLNKAFEAVPRYVIPYK